MTEEKNKNKKIPMWLIVLCIVLFLGFIANLVERSEAETTAKNNLKNIKTITEHLEKTQQELSTKEQISKDIKNILDTSSVIILEENTTYFIDISYNATEGFSAKQTRSLIWINSKKVFGELFNSYDNITYIAIHAYLPFFNEYGKSNIDLALRIAMDKETAKKINWENVLTENMPKVANDYYEHPAFSLK